MKNQGIQIVEIPSKEGETDTEVLAEKMDDQTAGVIVQSPNFLVF